MKILVTGATGFLGGWVLTRLSNEFGKERVCGTGRNRKRADELTAKGFTILIGDLTDSKFVEEYLQGFSHIVHCAARSSLWGDYNSFYHDNVVTTTNLLNGISTIERFIYISTPSIYFAFSDRFDVKEDSILPKKFVNHYASTKYIAKQEVMNFKKSRITKIILRPRAIVGAGDTVIVPRIIRAYNQGRLKIIGDGKNICDFTSVKNIAHAVYLAIVAERDIDGKIFNITDNDPKAIWPLLKDVLVKLGYNSDLKRINYRIVYLVATISEFVSRVFSGREPVLTKYGVGVLNYSTTLSVEEAKKHLNYKPIISTDESIDEFVNYYKSEISPDQY